ncbi:MAG: Uma2 family endonuclease [Lachnospiraceae bacterium]|nr:Uma2 family endonuclease [Lachnospiraceae bacterium]
MKLNEHLSDTKQESQEAQNKHSERRVYPDYEDIGPDRLKEAEVAYGRGKRQGEYTLEDYYALPDNIRAELIDGEMYLMSCPSWKHQRIVTRLSSLLYQYVDSKNGDCEVSSAPFDVQLDCNMWTMVQPDIMIICNPDRIMDNRICGAPDFVVEVLSPSTRKKDQTIKLRKYREAGVREYWMIDPEKEQIEVYLFRTRDLAVLPRVYSFDDIVPVGIYDGDCKVDFSKFRR